jgi:ERCC4-type nuclease
MKDNRFTIIADTRESPEYCWHFNEDAYCKGTIDKKVDTGDYTIEGLENFVCIERKKTIDEFAGNCTKKRWVKCMERMSEIKHSYILFEFPTSDIARYPYSSKAPLIVRRKLKLSPPFINKVIARAREEYGIHVIACGSSFVAEKVAYTILRKAYDLHLRR